MKDPYYYLPIDIGLGLERGEEFHSGKTVVRPNYQNKKLPFTVVAGASKIHCATTAQAAEAFIKLVGKSAAKQAVLEATRAAMKFEAEQNEQERRGQLLREGQPLHQSQPGLQALTHPPTKREADTMTTKVAKLNIQPNGSVVVNKITVSKSTIQGIAYKASGGDDALAQDCAQAMYESLFQHPVTVAQDSHAKVTTRMMWEAKHELRRQLTYKKHNLTTPVVVDDEGEEVDYFDLRESADPSPEVILIDICEQDEHRAQVQALLENVSTDTRRVARLIMAGYRPAEVARKLGICPSTVSRHLKIMREKAGG